MSMSGRSSSLSLSLGCPKILETHALIGSLESFVINTGINLFVPFRIILVYFFGTVYFATR
ncbi:hypothetical protein AGMMS50229_08480 [Campylobacterota bacterium]|nr:hypothetical protein AGMMS50229_08330 [Campylobacterota bacterium]GHV05418.1 hypothetical protein AGMMS50229_08480 [Campylobacterota bacterium]